MQKYVIALYIRLSLEDYKYDSMSIENQHLVLNEFVSSMPESTDAEVLEFIDNGYSGTNFERPKVQELIELVRANQIDCIIVKDFSRFGRNSIETGYFIERVFPLFHTRFISINDDFDSDQHKGDTGGMDVAFKYLISEYYSRMHQHPVSGLHFYKACFCGDLVSLKIHHSLIFLYRQHPSGQSNTHIFPLTAHRTGSRPSDSLSFLQPPTSESLLFLRQLKQVLGRFHCRQIIFYYTRFQPIFQPEYSVYKVHTFR